MHPPTSPGIVCPIALRPATGNESTLSKPPSIQGAVCCLPQHAATRLGAVAVMGMVYLLE